MKILAITPTFFPSLGGIETVIKELAIHLKAFDVQMDVAHVSTANKNYLSETLYGIKVIRIPLYGSRYVGFAPDLKDLAKEYDLLHVHDPQLLAISGNVALFCKHIPAVLSTHGGFNHTANLAFFKKLYERTFLSKTLSHYQKVLATSVGDLEYFKSFSDNVVLCSNGVDTNKFNKVIPSSSNNALRWIYWGRLSNNKRIDLVIDYVFFGHQMGFSIDLLVCGRDFDGILVDLKRKVDDFGLTEYVKFEEFLDDVALIDELGQRSVYITASEHEGFGLSIVEAMSAGLIVVCRDMIPLNSFITNEKNGFFLAFDKSDVDQSKLKSLLSLNNDAIKHISINAKNEADKYNWHSSCQRFLKYFQENL